MLRLLRFWIDPVCGVCDFCELVLIRVVVFAIPVIRGPIRFVTVVISMVWVISVITVILVIYVRYVILVICLI